MSALDDIHWDELSHAYGFAGNLPPLLRQLYNFPSEADATSEPWHSLWSSLYHQGDIYSASYGAVAVIVDAAATNPSRATASYFQLPACVDLARVRHRGTVPGHLSGVYSDALRRLPRLATDTTSLVWEPDLAVAKLAAIAVSTGQWAVAELLLEVESEDIPEVLEWYRNR